MSSENNILHPREIVSAYADILASINENRESEQLSIIPLALPESLLPFPYKTIKHALAIYLLHQNYNDQRAAIEEAYIFLDNFIPDEEYSLFLMLQSSKERMGYKSNIIEMLDIMNRLQVRTQSINICKEESIEELNALRRIMNLPDSLPGTESNKITSDYENTQELRLNI